MQRREISSILEVTLIPNAMVRTLERLQLSHWALLGFFLVLPLSLRHTFFSFSPLGGQTFNEYTDISLFASDLVLITFFLLNILENKRKYLSIIWWKRMFHVEQFRIVVLTPLPFLLWCLVSTFWSENQTLAFYASLKLFEGYLLYVFLILINVPRGTLSNDIEYCSTWNKNFDNQDQHTMFHVEQSIGKNEPRHQTVPRGTFESALSVLKNCSTWNTSKRMLWGIIISALVQATIALWQFLAQSSVGLSSLGESYLGAHLPGIAKVILLDQVIIRPYGLFPHPNILASYLGLSILLLIFTPVLFKFQLFHVEHFLKFYRVALFILLFVFLLTFSKSAIISLFIVIVYIVWQMFHVEHLRRDENMLLEENVPRGTIGSWLQLLRKCSTWNIHKLYSKMFHVEHLMMGSILIVLFLISILILRSLDSYYFITQPLFERWFYLQGFLRMVQEHFWIGVGIGQSVLLMPHFFVEKLLEWQLQPIHNLFLLIWAELGVIGLVIFLRICSTWNKFTSRATLFHVEQSERTLFDDRTTVPRGTILRTDLARIFARGMLIYLFLTALTDHYYWDIQQGQLIFWIIGALPVIINWRVLTK